MFRDVEGFGVLGSGREGFRDRFTPASVVGFGPHILGTTR